MKELLLHLVLTALGGIEFQANWQQESISLKWSEKEHHYGILFLNNLQELPKFKFWGSILGFPLCRFKEYL